MKFFSVLIYFFQNQTTKRNIIFLFKFFVFLFAIVCLYSLLFHLLMLYEGRQYSWITGFYWALTVMSTLGFGDITFQSDLGMFFTIIVLMTGIVFLLIILPFTFVQFFYAPWLEAQEKARTPREIPQDTKGHIILTSIDPLTKNLASKLQKYNYEHAFIASDSAEAQEIHDLGYRAVVGDLDDPLTYEHLRLENAALVVATNDDLTNTSISFTIRELTDRIPVITSADKEHSIDILEFPGNTHVFEFMKMLGQALAQRTIGVCSGTSILGNFGQLFIGEVPATGTPFSGKTLLKTRLREMTGLTIVGLWDRGKFSIPEPKSVINTSTVMVLAGSEAQLERYDRLFSIACADFVADAHVLILGGGRVGHAAAEYFATHHVEYAIVEKKPSLAKNALDKHIYGDAADINTLRKAGIENARTVLITTHNDAMNIYLAFYCRQLRSDIQIISRATAERTVSKLYRAGADLVMSYASMGANTILNFLRPNELSMFTEGLNIFTRRVPSSLVGKSLIESRIRERTGCSVISINSHGRQQIGPEAATMLGQHDELILIGTSEAEALFIETYST